MTGSDERLRKRRQDFYDRWNGVPDRFTDAKALMIRLAAWIVVIAGVTLVGALLSPHHPLAALPN